jgi:hypothetical protein
VACPLLTAPVPSTVAPSLKVTVPVGVTLPLTVAVKVTSCPNWLGFCDDANDVLVWGITVWDVLPELARKLVSAGV